MRCWRCENWKLANLRGATGMTIFLRTSAFKGGSTATTFPTLQICCSQSHNHMQVTIIVAATSAAQTVVDAPTKQYSQSDLIVVADNVRGITVLLLQARPRMRRPGPAWHRPVCHPPCIPVPLQIPPHFIDFLHLEWLYAVGVTHGNESRLESRQLSSKQSKATHGRVFH